MTRASHVCRGIRFQWLCAYTFVSVAAYMRCCRAAVHPHAMPAMSCIGFQLVCNMLCMEW